MVIRAELMQPGIQLVDPLFYNQMVSLHALVMIFGAVMPAFVGLANWQIPLMIGAPDMALPRMNNLVISSMAQLAGTSARRNERSGQGAVRTQVCASRPTNEARSKRRLTRNCTSAR